MADTQDPKSGVLIRGIRFGSADISAARSTRLAAQARSTRLTVPLGKRSHDALKVYAIEHDTTITRLVITLVEELLQQQA